MSGLLRWRYLWRCRRVCRGTYCWRWRRAADDRKDPQWGRTLTGRTWQDLNRAFATLGSKIEERSQLPALVIPTQKVYRILEPDLHRKNQRQHLHRKTPPIHVISQKEIFCRFQRPPCIVIDDLDEIVELPVDVSHNRHRILYFDHIGLLL